MKRIFLISLLAVSSAVFSAIPIDGLYAEIYGGYTYMPNNISTFLNSLYWDHVDYMSGYHGGGRFGFKNNPLRYDAEIAYISASVNKFRVNNVTQTGVTGQTSATMAMINAYYDFPEVIMTLTPFLGVGMGYAYVNAHLFGTGPTMATVFRGANSAFAYQGTLGIAYNFVDNYSLDIAYRYVATTHISELGNDFQAHLASAGVTYRFDGALYK